MCVFRVDCSGWIVGNPEIEISEPTRRKSLIWWPPRSSGRMLATALPLLSGRFPLAVTFGVDLLLSPRQHILRCDVAGGAVQTDVVVMLHVAFDQMPSLFQ